jgi:hypothetical protein
MDLDAQLAGDDARQVEDVLDQLGLRARVALDGLPAPSVPSRACSVREPQHVRPADHRVQRRAQLVRKRRQEFVLGAVGRLGRLARLALLHRQLGVSRAGRA